MSRYHTLDRWVFCPRAGPSLQEQEPTLQFCRRQVFQCKHRKQGCNSTTVSVVLLGINGCGSIPLLSALHSLFSIWTDLKRSEKIPGAPTWRWGEWIWLTGPSRLNRNSSEGLYISSIRVFDHIRDPEIPIILRPLLLLLLLLLLCLSLLLLSSDIAGRIVLKWIWGGGLWYRRLDRPCSR